MFMFMVRGAVATSQKKYDNWYLRSLPGQLVLTESPALFPHNRRLPQVKLVHILLRTDFVIIATRVATWHNSFLSLCIAQRTHTGSTKKLARIVDAHTLQLYLH